MEPIPTTYLGLFITLMLGMWSLIVFMVRAILLNQNKTTNVLDNHLSGIAINQAKTAEVLVMVSGKLLDAALRSPEKEKNNAPQA